VDYITNLTKAYENEQSHAAKDAIAQILINSRMCAEGHRPICQDVSEMPVTVAVDAKVTTVHQTGPAEWQQRIAEVPILQ